MTKEFLCGVTHTAQGINSELISYAIGCIKSYFHAKKSHEVDIALHSIQKTLPKIFLKPRRKLSGLPTTCGTLISVTQLHLPLRRCSRHINYFWWAELSAGRIEAGGLACRSSSGRYIRDG